MTEHLVAAETHTADCAPADRVTKSLLGYGVIAGPFYLVVALAQALTREGFDLGLHQWSLLANGGPGWIQIANFVITGAMVIAFAVGLRRALTPGQGARWAPRLVAIYGASLIAAGIFRADPALGFPVGTPAGPGAVSWHGMLHFAAGGVGFTCIAIACLVHRPAVCDGGRPRLGLVLPAHRCGLPGRLRHGRVRRRQPDRQPGLHRGDRADLGLAVRRRRRSLPSRRTPSTANRTAK